MNQVNVEANDVYILRDYESRVAYNTLGRYRDCGRSCAGLEYVGLNERHDLALKIPDFLEMHV